MALTRAQVDALLRPINSRRVLRDQRGNAHLSQQDVRAHLTRIFGFGGWDSEVLELRCVAEEIVKNSKDDDAWAVTYLCRLRLIVKDGDGNRVASYDDVGTGTSPKLPTKGDAHDFAAKVAVSIALKRAATNLGDGFGLSLYNKGQVAPLVIDTLVKPDGEATDTADVQEQVPQQVSLGHDDDGSSTDNSPNAALPESTSDQVSGRADSGPATSSDAAPAPSDAAHTAEDVARSLRDRAIEAVSMPKRKGIQTMARLNAEAARGRVMLAPVERPDGTVTTLNVLLDEAMKRLNRSPDSTPAADPEPAEVPA